jgi:hypothetical protein
MGSGVRTVPVIVELELAVRVPNGHQVAELRTTRTVTILDRSADVASAVETAAEELAEEAKDYVAALNPRPSMQSWGTA